MALETTHILTAVDGISTNQNLAEQAAEIFLNAARYIRSYGWQVKGMSVHGKPRCSMGAIASAHPGTWNADVATLMYRALSTTLHGMTLTDFNEKAQNGEDVARLFEQVAASCALFHYR